MMATKRKSKMERELEVQDSPRLRQKRKAWAQLVREFRRDVRRLSTRLKREEKALAKFEEGLRILDKVLAPRKRKPRAGFR